VGGRYLLGGRLRALLLAAYIGYNDMFAIDLSREIFTMNEHRGYKPVLLAGLALSTAVFTGCAGMTTGSNGTSGAINGATDPTGSYSATSSNAKTASDLSTVKTWSIKTARFLGKTPTADELAADTSDLLIVAPADLQSKDHSLDKQVASIRGKGPKRILLAMVDAGYMTPSSPMWDAGWVNGAGKLGATAPAWLEAPDKNGSTRYRIQYWAPDWRTKLSAEVERLRKAGFDGVCIDGVNAADASNQERTTSYLDMATLIQNEAHDARTHATNFYIAPFDNDGLVDKLTDAQRLDYLKTVDAVVASNVFYHNQKNEDEGATTRVADLELNPQPEMITTLDRYQYAHRPVLVIDTVSSADKVADFQERAKARGYLPWSVSTPAASPSTPSGASSTVAPATPATPPNAPQKSI